MAGKGSAIEHVLTAWNGHYFLSVDPKERLNRAPTLKVPDEYPGGCVLIEPVIENTKLESSIKFLTAQILRNLKLANTATWW